MEPPLIIRNDAAVFNWAFCLAWIGALVAMSWWYLRGPGFGHFHAAVEAAIMAIFWIFGLVLIAWTLKQSQSRLTVRNGQATLVRWWPWRRQERTLTATALRNMVVRRDRDSDGDPYYRLLAQDGSNEELVISESHNLKIIEAVQADILKRL